VGARTPSGPTPLDRCPVGACRPAHGQLVTDTPHRRRGRGDTIFPPERFLALSRRWDRPHEERSRRALSVRQSYGRGVARSGPTAGWSGAEAHAHWQKASRPLLFWCSALDQDPLPLSSRVKSDSALLKRTVNHMRWHKEGICENGMGHPSDNEP
jgi:hypothetical protein